MSGQSLTAVVSALVDSMRRTPTLNEQLEAYLRTLCHHYDTNDDNWDGTFRALMNKHPSDDPIVQCYLNGMVTEVGEYVDDHCGWVIPDVTIDDDTSVRNEVLKFKQFLHTHQYSGKATLVAIGFSAHLIDRTLWKGAHGTDPPLDTFAMDLWHISRTIGTAEQVDTVSVGTWLTMYKIVPNMVYQCMLSRVKLSKDEEREIIMEALNKRRMTQEI